MALTETVMAAARVEIAMAAARAAMETVTEEARAAMEAVMEKVRARAVPMETETDGTRVRAAMETVTEEIRARAALAAVTEEARARAEDRAAQAVPGRETEGLRIMIPLSRRNRLTTVRQIRIITRMTASTRPEIWRTEQDARAER